jgi:predicted dehydrogenase
MTRPKLGFLGVGWIGQHRMRAVLESGVADVVAIAEPDRALREAALALAPSAEGMETLDALLERELDGVAIATPSALHAEQTLAALRKGCAVFCQKPLARSGAETRAVVECARAENRLLHVDFSYRHTAALQALKALLPELGPIHASRLVFHNAYGPDKPWYYDRRSSGGGCVMDLGVHLIDAALWLFEDAQLTRVESALFVQGERLEPLSPRVEDFASVRMQLQSGSVIELACSWKLPVGHEAEIGIELFGAHGAARMRNVNGSFYDFVAERMQGTSRSELVQPPDAWGGRAAVAWAKQLAKSADFDPQADRFIDVADVIDRIYGKSADLPRERQNAARDRDTPHGASTSA